VLALHTKVCTAEEIAREIGADWILEGSVRRGDDKHLFRTALIGCSTMSFAWNRDFACSQAGWPGLPDLRQRYPGDCRSSHTASD
jgi:TolB-like protein